MILYHFTARDWLPAIAREGLSKGTVALSLTEHRTAVWLTTDHNPVGHGLSEGRQLTVDEKRARGMPPEANCVFPNKRAIRFKLRLPSTPSLVHWPKWAKRRVEASIREALTATADDGPGRAETWWLYLGTIAPDRLTECDDLEPGMPLKGWPDTFLQMEPVAEAVRRAR